LSIGLGFQIRWGFSDIIYDDQSIIIKDLIMSEAATFFSYPSSVIHQDSTTYCLEHDAKFTKKRLMVEGDLQGFHGEKLAGGQLACDLSPENAAALRERLPWLKAVPLGLATSAGMGDRLGLATPGHVAAVSGTGIAPIFAQQSVRENTRTGRKPQEVMDDAMWGVFQTGWKGLWGADADHLKKIEDLETFVEAGYTFFTVDPGDHVDQAADGQGLAGLREKAVDLPWEELKTTQQGLLSALTGKSFQIEGFSLDFDEEIVLRAAVKYGRAVAHANRMYRRLVELHGSQPFDFEVSVDETATPTSAQEHFYIAHELKRLGVVWTSLAPRFVGKFEKGVDYQGDLAELDQTMGQHAAIMRFFGSYKLSLHSGSDKFSVYPIAARHTGRLVHLKTAGTSYLEALRVIAQVDPVFFRKIYLFARERYETDRASYHVSAELSKAPAQPADIELPDLLNQFDARQVLHVTFGSVLDTFGSELYAVLRAHEDEYYAVLEQHFRKHLLPLKP
jgi:tagaturonate epimerase